MPGLRNANESGSIEGSPLLARAEGNSSTESNPQSTVHADRFDMARFTERKENKEESSLRIILYVIVVIIIGVGLALLVRTLISNQSQNEPNENNSENETPTDQNPVESSNISISTAMKSDPSDAPTNEELVDALSLSVGNSNASVENVSVSRFSYSKFTTFARMNFMIDGVTNEAELPKIAINYDSTRNSLDIVLPSEMEINENLKETIQINDTVSNVTFNANTNTFTVNVASGFKYLVIPTTAGLTVDVKTLEQIEGPSTEEPETEEPVEEEPETETPETPDPEEEPSTPPSGTRLDNEFSRQKQFVSGGVSGNSIVFNETYFSDLGDFFEIAWGRPEFVGTEYTPYATAESVTEDGIPFIRLTIENLESIEFEPSGVFQNNIPVNLVAANFVRADLESFSNGKAVIMIQLKNEADYRLISTTTISGLTQVLALQIRD